MSTPNVHIQEAELLTADGLVDLYKLDLKNDPVSLRFKDMDDVTWQGHLFEGMACRLTGDSRSSDGEEARPSLQVMNPLGIFNSAIIEGKVDQAVVTRYRVLRRHIDNNSNIYEQRMWYVNRVKELISGQSVTFELRSMTEGPNFQIPVRMFLPPEFPTVSL